MQGTSVRTSSMKEQRKSLGQGLLLGLTAAAFFSVSFVLNRKMADAAGHWAWSASLRFLMMVPVLALIITARRQWSRFWEMWHISRVGWIAWGTLGCGIFYAALTAACSVSPAWVVAATWPVAIVIGILLGPLLYDDHRRKIPKLALLFSTTIVAGVVLLQAEEFRAGNAGHVLLGILLVLASATAHPLGNRKSMNLMEAARLPADAILRLSLMIFGSLPLCGLLCLWGFVEAGPPPPAQLATVALVAAAGLIATPLFYMATDRVNRDAASLAAVEATQAAEIVFTLLLEAWLIGIRPPGALGILGLILITGGMLLHARPTSRRPLVS
ncbi:multidrug resistance efflux transporter family protein [Luteolibacter arcticus]|uniref:Multidrug resistance efflux transporter family protein n=1 Tax=Luteolibacter arcticus TaxID=1581411 RepID=A0ABT3GI52_9BACT|nr:multidrug resistance efflux transporter family protein [Luteolibacter arcticus]MCW1923190.1 multidrug resistance efflux transporter family protein [Luteolibacter arcticus]